MFKRCRLDIGEVVRTVHVCRCLDIYSNLMLYQTRVVVSRTTLYILAIINLLIKKVTN